MAKKRNEDIEAAAFSQLGYPVVKAEQLEAVREFMKGQDVFVSIPIGSEKSLRQSWHGLQGFHGSTIATLNAHLSHVAFELAL